MIGTQFPPARILNLSDEGRPNRLSPPEATCFIDSYWRFAYYLRDREESSSRSSQLITFHA